MSKASLQTVVVDGEPVTFEGPPPAELSQLYQLLDQALTSQGRMIQAFSADGTDVHAQPERLENPQYQEVIATSTSWEAACKATTENLLEQADAAAQALIAYGSAMMAVPLVTSLKEINTAADKMGALIAPIETAQQFATQFSPDWAAPIQALLQRCGESCEHFTQALQDQDLGLAADMLTLTLPDALASFKKVPQTPWNPEHP